MAALKAQTRPVDQVIVTVRDIDTETWEFLELFSQPGDRHDLSLGFPLQTVKVCLTGVVAAMNAGLSCATGDIIAFTDDDAAPRPQWLEQIETYFTSDAKIAAVGGRDWQWNGTQIREPGEREVVGLVQWFGRPIGNHHLAVGQAREVDVLKGVNMAFRRSAIQGMQFDNRMRGSGAQVHFELAFNLALRRAGWKIIFDPAVAVDHYPAQRFDEDQRDNFNDLAWTNAVHNETLALLEHFAPWQRLVFWVWAFAVGTREALGIVQYIRLLPAEGAIAQRKWLASVKGRWQGLQTWRESRQTPPFSQPVSKI